ADLVPAGIEPRDANRVFVRLGAAVREEEGVDIAWRQLGKFRTETPAHLGRHKRIRIRQLVGLVLDRLDHAFIAVTNVDAHQLAVEVDKTFTLRRPKINPLGARNWNRIDSSLCGPFKQRMPATEFNNLLAR